MEKIVVKIGGKHHKYCLSNTDQNAKVSLGRAFSNDIIIEDPHIGSCQLSIAVSPDEAYQWRLSNIDTTNPVLVNKVALGTPDIDLKSGDKITIGRTEVVFYAENHPVPEARAFSLANWLHSHKFSPLFACLMLLTLFGITLGVNFLETSSELEWGKLSATAIIPLLLVFIWASGWSLTGRFLKNDSYFFSHLFFTALLFCLLILSEEFPAYIDYMFSSPLSGEIINWLIITLIFGLLISFNLALVTFSPRTLKKGLISSACIFGVISSLMYLYQDDYQNVPAHTSTIKPSYIPTLSPVSADKFISNYAELFKTLGVKN